MRIDLFLVEKSLAPSRARAQDWIAKGRVFLIDGNQRTRLKKPSLQVPDDAQIEVESDPESDRFVSRGGIKMQGALDRTGLKTQGLRVLDIGISTGGFTDCLLQAGVKSVIGVDVGHDQLADRLRNDPRVFCIEGVNARDLSQVPLIEKNGGRTFDLIVVDVSFISLSLILPAAVPLLGNGFVLALVKPQFEVGWKNLGKGGIVKDASLYSEVETKIREACAAAGLAVEDYFESSIEGTDGNREFFVLASRPRT